MAVTVALDNSIIPDPIDETQQEFEVYLTLTLSGTYGGASTHGDTMALGNLGISGLINTVEIYEQPTAGNAPTGYQFLWGKGTTPNNGVLIVLQNAASANNPNAEITAAGAYPAALTAATANIKAVAYFTKFV